MFAENLGSGWSRLCLEADRKEDYALELVFGNLKIVPTFLAVGLGEASRLANLEMEVCI
jgi:hypothetical protein